MPKGRPPTDTLPRSPSLFTNRSSAAPSLVGSLTSCVRKLSSMHSYIKSICLLVNLFLVNSVKNRLIYIVICRSVQYCDKGGLFDFAVVRDG